MNGNRDNASLRQLPTVAAPTSAAAEAYRTVAVNLRYGGDEPRPKTIVFSGAGNREDTSNAIANVAVAAAQSQRFCPFSLQPVSSVFFTGASRTAAWAS